MKDKIKDQAATTQKHRMKLGEKPSPAKFGKSGGTKNIGINNNSTGKSERK